MAKEGKFLWGCSTTATTPNSDPPTLSAKPFPIEGINIGEQLTTNCREFLFPQEVRATEQGEGKETDRQKGREKGKPDPNMK